MEQSKNCCPEVNPVGYSIPVTYNSSLPNFSENLTTQSSIITNYSGGHQISKYVSNTLVYPVSFPQQSYKNLHQCKVFINKLIATKNYNFFHFVFVLYCLKLAF